MKSFLLKSWVGTVLSFITGFSPVATAREVIPVPQRPAVVISVPQTSAPRMAMIQPVLLSQPATNAAPLYAAVQHYTYVVEGKATYEGQPCANAKVDLQISDSQGEQVQHVTTAQDGSYSLKVSLEGAPNDPVNWTLRALTSDFHKVEMEGNQILMGDPQITVEKSLEFAAG